jgi:murein DD-endopeptidase MepM/ murein hydrolase activator NlpD
MVRTIAVLTVLGALAPAPSGAPAPARRTASNYTAPVAPVRVVRPFLPPPTPYAAGHRGVDLAVRPGAPVHAAAAGVISFAGSIAGRGVVVVRHPDGISTEYEPVRVGVKSGATVQGGDLLGTVAGRHGSCAAGTCLHWGARRDSVYLDPLLLLRPLGRVRLLPWDGA